MNFPKIIIVLLVIMFGSFMLGAMFFFASGEFKLTPHPIDESKTIDMDQVNEIKIDVSSEDVTFTQTDSEELEVSLTGEINTKDLKYDLKVIKRGDIIIIGVDRTSVFGFFHYSNLDLEVFLPKSYTGSIDISSSSGDVVIEDYVLNRFSASSSSGDIDAVIDAEKVKCSTSSGSVNLKGVVGSLDCSSSSGEIAVEGAVAKSDIDTSSGSVMLDYGAVGDIDVRTSSGSVMIDLPDDAEFYLDFSAGSGGVTNSFPIVIEDTGRNELKGVVGDGTHEILVSTSSGSLDLS